MTTALKHTEAASAAGQASSFEPRIIAFVCKWCTYAGADLAGTSRMVYPSNVRTIMLPCTGRIDVTFVLRAFLQGADGVIVSGCHPGDCHYTAGNYRARRRWTLFRDLLDVVGFDLNRFDLAWISAAEGAKWVKMIESFTNRIRKLGPYEAMHKIAAEHLPQTPPASDGAPAQAADVAPEIAAPPDPKLIAAVADAIETGKAKVVLGWVKNRTLGRPRPSWVTTAEAAGELIPPGDSGNLARLLKNPQLRSILPLGIVARSREVMALNVLVQEAQLDPAQVIVFAVEPDGTFLGTMSLEGASDAVLATTRDAPTERPAGFSDETLKAVDALMAKSPEERWAFWSEQSARCIRCYACRGSCPMCTCEQCFVDKNQPQWFPTASDGPGNFAWQLVRAFHLAGRCVGCGACEDACPAGIQLSLLSAAMARSAAGNFGHRAGLDPKAVPLQSDYRQDDKEEFIL